MDLLVTLIALAAGVALGAALLRTRIVAAETRLAAEREATIQRVADLERSEAQLKESFQALSQQALEANGRQFLEMARDTLKTATTKAEGDLEQRKQAVEHLVEPVQKALERMSVQVEQIEQERRQAYGGLRNEVQQMRASSDQLRQETGALVTALRKPQARGSWGEMQLQRVVELAGMAEHCDFDLQVTTADGSQRPDMVVRLPGDKEVVVDSKAPLEAFLDVVDAPDEAARKAALVRHGRHLRTHIDALAKKDYSAGRDCTPEFVVLFVPGEALLSAALEGDHTLLEYGAERSVLIATPTTLIAMLRTIAYSLTQEKLAESAREVRDLGRELYKRLADMGGHVDKLGRNLETVVRSYNDAVGSLEGRVLVTARKIAACGVTEALLDTPRQVEQRPRELQAEELVISAAESRPVTALPKGERPAELDDEMRRAAGLF